MRMYEAICCFSLADFNIILLWCCSYSPMQVHEDVPGIQSFLLESAVGVWCVGAMDC
jgi:hypothetical protein